MCLALSSSLSAGAQANSSAVSQQPSHSSSSSSVAVSSSLTKTPTKEKNTTDSFSPFRATPRPRVWEDYFFVPAKQPLADVWESDIPHDVKLNFSCALQFKHIAWPSQFLPFSTSQSCFFGGLGDGLVKLTDGLRKEFLILVWNWARGCLSDQDYVTWLKTNESILVCKKQSSFSSASESMHHLYLDDSTDTSLVYFLEPFGFL